MRTASEAAARGAVGGRNAASALATFASSSLRAHSIACGWWLDSSLLADWRNAQRRFGLADTAASNLEAVFAAFSWRKGSHRLDDGKLTSCYGGALGQQLLKEASAAWNHQFPSRATVPHTFINHKDVPAIYSQLKKAICAAGDTSPACSSDGQACSA